MSSACKGLGSLKHVSRPPFLLLQKKELDTSRGCRRSEQDPREAGSLHMEAQRWRCLSGPCRQSSHSIKLLPLLGFQSCRSLSPASPPAVGTVCGGERLWQHPPPHTLRLGSGEKGSTGSTHRCGSSSARPRLWWVNHSSAGAPGPGTTRQSVFCAIKDRMYLGAAAPLLWCSGREINFNLGVNSSLGGKCQRSERAGGRRVPRLTWPLQPGCGGNAATMQHSPLGTLPR